MQVTPVTLLLVLVAVPGAVPNKVDKEVEMIFARIREEVSWIIKDLAEQLNDWMEQEFTNTSLALFDRLDESAGTVISLLPTKMEILRRGSIAKIILEAAKDSKYGALLGYSAMEWVHTVSGIQYAVQGVFMRLAIAMERIHDEEYLLEVFSMEADKVQEYYTAIRRETFYAIWGAGHGVYNARMRRRAKLEFSDLGSNMNMTMIGERNMLGEEEDIEENVTA
ncbi:uncharacterized protein LOC118404393 [Branchiostoma floridae]|uniref:Uncharacterized protein LOC118404393 n=1 Tax=Branchiostoma floridae TaxID=7739 RepID=A0A9J7HH48_BRAFL|nr:uncharacterized protein LOC118404393 [Branchiostoma floridae]